MSDETATTEVVTEGAQGAAASEGSGAGASPSAESDFKRRAMADPEWAWEQVRGFQSAADKAKAAEEKHNDLVGQLGEAREIIDQYGGQVVANAVKNYAQLRMSDEYGKDIQSFEQTGQLPTRAGSDQSTTDSEEYLTDEEREIRTLKATVQDLSNRVGENTRTSGREVLKGHIEKVFSEFDFEPEVKERMRSAVVNQFETWSRAGSAGEAAVQAVMQPTGEKTVRGLMLSGVTPDDLMNASGRTALRKKNGLSTLATDVPGATGSKGTEPPPQFATAIEAAKYAAANPDAIDAR